MAVKSYAELSDIELDKVVSDIINDIKLKKDRLSEVNDDIETLLKYQNYLIKVIEGER
ncbi:MAG: hypothetical protein LVQ96_00225 [Thermoplasmatales archaeon]|nr:hypothetical protein [Thermoplasmatales archaeon]MCW6169588.1 hypothetical protein [Thermoplasmatales archaeon]